MLFEFVWNKNKLFFCSNSNPSGIDFAKRNNTRVWTQLKYRFAKVWNLIWFQLCWAFLNNLFSYMYFLSISAPEGIQSFKNIVCYLVRSKKQETRNSKRNPPLATCTANKTGKCFCGKFITIFSVGLFSIFQLARDFKLKTIFCVFSFVRVANQKTNFAFSALSAKTHHVRVAKMFENVYEDFSILKFHGYLSRVFTVQSADERLQVHGQTW